MVTDPPEQCAADVTILLVGVEFAVLAFAGLGVGSGRYMGDGGEYGGGTAGLGGVGVLIRLTNGVAHAGVTIFTFTGRIGDLLAHVVLDLLGFGELRFLANETDLDLLVRLGDVGVLVRALRGGDLCRCLGSTVQGLAGLYVSNLWFNRLKGWLVIRGLDLLFLENSLSI